MNNMADHNLIVSFEIEWHKGDIVAPCKYCEDMIVSGSNTLMLKVTTPKSETMTETDYTICNSCYELINE